MLRSLDLSDPLIQRLAPVPHIAAEAQMRNPMTSSLCIDPRGSHAEDSCDLLSSQEVPGGPRGNVSR